ncbi:Crp/Fnr family transcriptional regulator [Cryomorphaceae bacterium]|nr:Crp/Fnr family transcriptional regulator [Cryomorphaceae bacterium]
MTGAERLRQYIEKFSELTTEEVDEFVGAFEEVRVKKRQFLVQPNFTATHRHYVVDGAFRAYVVGEKGTDHTISFAIDDWWITDYNSYIFQRPATMFVVALEDSVIMRLSFAQEQQLKKGRHNFETAFRKMAERGLAFYQRRIISNLTMNAEERYDHFLQTYPEIVQRVPQYAMASYLGMTTEFLSKIRNHKVKRKS